MREASELWQDKRGAIEDSSVASSDLLVCLGGGGSLDNCCLGACGLGTSECPLGMGERCLGLLGDNPLFDDLLVGDEFLGGGHLGDHGAGPGHCNLSSRFGAFVSLAHALLPLFPGEHSSHASTPGAFTSGLGLLPIRCKRCGRGSAHSPWNRTTFSSLSFSKRAME